MWNKSGKLQCVQSDQIDTCAFVPKVSYCGCIKQLQTPHKYTMQTAISSCVQCYHEMGAGVEVQLGYRDPIRQTKFWTCQTPLRVQHRCIEQLCNNYMTLVSRQHTCHILPITLHQLKQWSRPWNCKVPLPFVAKYADVMTIHQGFRGIIFSVCMLSLIQKQPS